VTPCERHQLLVWRPLFSIIQNNNAKRRDPKKKQVKQVASLLKKSMLALVNDRSLEHCHGNFNSEQKLDRLHCIAFCRQCGVGICQLNAGQAVADIAEREGKDANLL
jgi:hypothetical protein